VRQEEIPEAGGSPFGDVPPEVVAVAQDVSLRLG
jgi:hypothetical protein